MKIMMGAVMKQGRKRGYLPRWMKNRGELAQQEAVIEKKMTGIKVAQKIKEGTKAK